MNTTANNKKNKSLKRANSENSISINISELKIARLNKLRSKEMTKGLTKNEEKEFDKLLKELEQKGGRRKARTMKKKRHSVGRRTNK